MASTSFQAASRRSLTGGFLGSLFAVGLTIYLFGVFQDALIEAFSTTVGTLSFAPALFTGVSGVLSPLVGRSLGTSARSGQSIRFVMSCGAVVLGAGLIGVSRSTTLGWAAAAFAGLVAPGAILLGPLLGQALVTNWFDAQRGRALGIVSAGTTVGGMLMPPLAATLIEGIGWRDAMATLGALSIFVVLPLVRFLVVDRPEQIGEGVDGMDEPSKTTANMEPVVAVGTVTLLRNPSLWLVGITFGLVFSAGMISTIFMIPYAGELGIPLLGGSLIASARAGAAAFGKIVFGSISDRVGVRPVLYGVIGTEVLLTLILVQTRSPVVFVVIGVAIGFVGGSPLPLKAAMTGQVFGRSNFPAAMGLLQTVGVPFQLCMVPLAGAIYGYADSYAAVFALTLPCFVLGAVALYFVPLLSSGPSSPR